VGDAFLLQDQLFIYPVYPEQVNAGNLFCKNKTQYRGRG
jgi:hypothetical protein